MTVNKTTSWHMHGTNPNYIYIYIYIYIHTHTPHLSAGFNSETVEFKNFNILAWDLGGRDKMVIILSRQINNLSIYLIIKNCDFFKFHFPPSCHKWLTNNHIIFLLCQILPTVHS